MRGTGADAKPALLRVDGDGTIQPIAIEKLAYTKVALLERAGRRAEGRRNPRADSVTDMSFVSGKLIVAGLSNEEFASKLRSFAYPFVAADPGTSVEIFHGNHGALETRSPVYTFIPYTIDSKPYVIASYTCTPLVRFSMESLKGTKVVGTTIAELGAGNRPLDMILYKKDGKEFLLMSNNSRGVMKIPTADFGTAPGITAKVTTRDRRDRLRDDHGDDGRRADGPAGRAALDRPGARRRRASTCRPSRSRNIGGCGLGAS